jgi:nicotinamidase-related amidase
MPHVSVLETALAAFVVIDVQERMLGAVTTSPGDDIIKSTLKLIAAARVLEIPILYTEQNPSGFGPTDARLKDALAGAVGPLVKTTCSCWRDEGFRRALQQTRHRSG